MKKNVSIVAIAVGIIALASCKKENAVTTLPEAKEQQKMTAISSTSYDYSQSIEQILSDAGVSYSSSTMSSLAVPGVYGGEIGSFIICNRSSSVCQIIVYSPKKNQLMSSGNKTIIGGSEENPIGIVQALPNWPSYSLASEVSYWTEEDSTFINNIPLP